MAERELAITARFYSPPRQRSRKSYSHVYLLRPDGTGRVQLTSGEADDYSPRWAPDGQRLVFQRVIPGHSRSVLVIGATGRGEKLLWRGTSDTDPLYRWDDATHVQITVGEQTFRYDVATGQREVLPPPEPPRNASPNGQRWLEPSGDEGKFLLVDKDGSRVAVLPRLRAALWLDNQELLVALATESEEPLPRLGLLSRDGSSTRPYKLLPTSDARRQQGAISGVFDTLVPHPVLPGKALLVYGDGDSTVGHHWASLQLDTVTGIVDAFGPHGRLAFSPDKRSFVTTFLQERTDYGRGRTVTTQRLYRGEVSRPRERRTLLRGLVDVSSCDWRGGSELVLR